MRNSENFSTVPSRPATSLASDVRHTITNFSKLSRIIFFFISPIQETACSTKFYWLAKAKKLTLWHVETRLTKYNRKVRHKFLVLRWQDHNPFSIPSFVFGAGVWWFGWFGATRVYVERVMSFHGANSNALHFTRDCQREIGGLEKHAFASHADGRSFVSDFGGLVQLLGLNLDLC